MKICYNLLLCYIEVIKIKIIAYIYKNEKFQLVTINQAIYSRKNTPLEFKNTIYYANPSFVTPVTPVEAEGSVFFRRINSELNNNSEKDNNSETIEHQLIKKCICSLTTINFKTKNQNDLTFYNCTCEPEKTLYVNGFRIKADIYVKFESCNYAEYNKAWNNNFIIEIPITHPVDDAKKYNLKVDNLATIEIVVNDKFKSIICQKATKFVTIESIDNALNYIKNSFAKNNIFSNIIVDPMSDVIFQKKIKNYKQQIEDINNKLLISENNIKILENRCDQLSDTINNDKNTISSLKKEILSLNTIINSFKKSKFYKLYKMFNHNN